MMKAKKYTALILSFLILLAFFPPMQTNAETRQEEIATVKRGDTQLMILFTYDAEIVDIVFISPSGRRIAAGDPDLDFREGSLWRSYRILNPEPGTWSVEYDMKSNTEIHYSLMGSVEGLSVQYFQMDSLDESSAKFRFLVDRDSGKIYYNYAVYAVSTDDETLRIQVETGHAYSGSEATCTARLGDLPSGNYYFLLEITYEMEEMNLSDSETTDAVDYRNPNPPQDTGSFSLTIDTTNQSLDITNLYSYWGKNEYRVDIFLDDEQFLSQEFSSDTGFNGSAYLLMPRSDGVLTVKTYHRAGSGWDFPRVRTVDLNTNYLRFSIADVTGSGNAELNYALPEEEVRLKVTVNDSTSTYTVSGTGTLAVPMDPGVNMLHAEVDVRGVATFVADRQVFFDNIPPEIHLYESLNGNTFFQDSVTLLGKIMGGNKLTVNGKDAKVEEDGSFQIVAALTPGENTLELEAWDVNGNASRVTLTLYRGSDGIIAADPATGWKQFLPLGGALLFSIVIGILSFFFLKKKNGPTNPRLAFVGCIIRDIVLLLADAGIWVLFFLRRKHATSLEFLAKIEASLSEAAAYLRMNNYLFIAGIAVAALLLVSVVITIITGIRRKHKEEPPQK